MTARMVLRAELIHERGQIVGHTTSLSQSSAFIRTDERLDLGQAVQLRLSFPRLLAPLLLDARVTNRSAESGHGYYAGFQLDFPIEAKLERVLGATTGASVEYRILLVEDSQLARDTVVHLAKARSIRFVTTSVDSAERALELVRTESFDLALVDYFLTSPSTGADFVSELRKVSDLPVIALSVGGAKARTAFLAAGADLYLDKPVQLRDLFATLEQLLAAGETT